MNHRHSPLVLLGQLSAPLGLHGLQTGRSANIVGSRPPVPLGLASTLLSSPSLLAQMKGPASRPAPQQPLLDEPEGARSLINKPIPHTLVDVTRPLFDGSGSPKLDHVVQGNLPTCPLAAILMAMALCHPDAVKGMLVPLPVTHMPSRLRSTNATLTSARGFIAVFPRNVTRPTATHPGHAAVISSSVYVNAPQFSGGVRWVGPNEVIYLRSTPSGDPATGVVWPGLIEKGYAVLKGGYSALENPAVEEVMFDLCGNFDWVRFQVPNPANVGGFSATLFANISDSRGTAASNRNLTAPQLDTELAGIFSRCRQRPTIACTEGRAHDNKFLKQHCYAVTGFDPSARSVTLRNPLVRAMQNVPDLRPQYTVSLAEFKSNFGSVLQART